MGEDRIAFNISKCEYMGIARNFYELWHIAEGDRDYAEWALTDGVGFAILLGLTPMIDRPPLGFYNMVWGRWRNDRIIIAGDYTGELTRVDEMCPLWRSISGLVDLAVADFFIYLTQNAPDEEAKRRYRGVALYLLWLALGTKFTVADPQRIRMEVAEITVETGSLSLALDVVYSRMTETWKYCPDIIEEYEKPQPYYIASGCWASIADKQLEILDYTKVFETDLLSDYTVIPSDIAMAWDGFLKMVEECPDSPEC